MKILRRKNKVFSKKNEGDETKLKVLDKLSVWDHKLNGKSGRERTRRYLEGKRDTLLDPKISAIQGAVSGSVLALPAWDTPILALGNKKYKKAAVLSAGGAAINPMIYRGAGYLNKRKLKKNPHANDRKLDLLDVADGKMTKSEFAKKWYSGIDRDTDEKLYSVLMSEEDLALFSNLVNEDPFEFLVEDVFYVTGRGTVLTGKVVSGIVCLKDKVILNNKSHKIKELVGFGKKLEKAVKGDKIGICLEGLSKSEVKRGDKLTK